MSDTNEEKIWLVDENDVPVGEGWQWRSPIQKVNWQNFRVVNVFIRNQQGQLWIPRRSAHKKMFPNCLDASVGGHVTYLETYEQALKHEVLEEVGIDVDQVQLKEIGYLNPKVRGLSAWMKVWEFFSEEVPSYNRDDFSEASWMFPDEIRERIRAGDQVMNNLKVLMGIFYQSK